MKIATAIAVMALGGLIGKAEVEAASGTINFEEFVHGSEVSSSMGVAISGKNTIRNHRVVVAFDTNLSGTRDSDLEGPGWASGNIASSNPIMGKALIIQERLDDTPDGIQSLPDDEGGRPAGYIKFDFGTNLLSSIGWDIIDVEDSTNEATSVKFYDSMGSSVTKSWAQLEALQMSKTSGAISLGNNSINRFDPILASSELMLQDIKKVKFKFGGSMAIDNIKFEMIPDTAVPEPRTYLSMSLGLLLATSLRKRSLTAAE